MREAGTSLVAHDLEEVGEVARAQALRESAALDVDFCGRWCLQEADVLVVEVRPRVALVDHPGRADWCGWRWLRVLDLLS